MCTSVRVCRSYAPVCAFLIGASTIKAVLKADMQFCFTLYYLHLRFLSELYKKCFSPNLSFKSLRIAELIKERINIRSNVCVINLMEVQVVLTSIFVQEYFDVIYILRPCTKYLYTVILKSVLWIIFKQKPLFTFRFIWVYLTTVNHHLVESYDSIKCFVKYIS